MSYRKYLMTDDVPPSELYKTVKIDTDSDTISRQAAIYAIDEQIEQCDKSLSSFDISLKDTFAVKVERASLVAFREILEYLPSAQPEIIQCKDCKHWIPYDWMFSEVWQSRNINDYPEDEIGCNYCDMSMKANDFCSRAERKEVTE